MDVFYYLTTSHGQRIIDAVADQLTSKRDCSRSPEITRLLERDQARAHELPLLAAPPPPTPLRAGALGSTAAIVPLPGAAAAVLRPGRTVSRPSVVTQSRAP